MVEIPPQSLRRLLRFLVPPHSDICLNPHRAHLIHDIAQFAMRPIYRVLLQSGALQICCRATKDRSITTSKFRRSVAKPKLVSLSTASRASMEMADQTWIRCKTGTYDADVDFNCLPNANINLGILTCPRVEG